MEPNQSIFADGGCIGRNPSRLGGTWAWILVEGDKTIQKGSGIIRPEDVGVKAVTNNLSELMAAVRALEALPEGWKGRLWSDSQVTLYRLCGSNRWEGIPPWLRRAAERLVVRHPWVEFSLIGGHPTAKDLEAGKLARNGLPCSKWNAACDKRCSQLAMKYK